MEQREDAEPLRRIFEARLWEISPVTFAADPAARIAEVNSQESLPALTTSWIHSAERELMEHETAMLAQQLGIGTEE